MSPVRRHEGPALPTLIPELAMKKNTHPAGLGSLHKVTPILVASFPHRFTILFNAVLEAAGDAAGRIKEQGGVAGLL